MKRILFSLLTILLLTLPCLAQTSFTKAEELYKQGKYAMALTIYESELKKATNNPYVYYNIGNCYFKIGNKGLAIANYYRAFKLAPRDADIRHNLKIAFSASGESFIGEEIPEFLHKAFYFFSYNELKGLNYLLLWIGSLFFVGWMLNKRFKKLFLICLFFIIVSASCWYAFYRMNKTPMAVVALPSTEVRSGPGVNFPVSVALGQGHIVYIEATDDAWTEVIIKTQGIKGWVETNSIEVI